jgi:LuxR family transcriptional regulator
MSPPSKPPLQSVEKPPAFSPDINSTFAETRLEVEAIANAGYSLMVNLYSGSYDHFETTFPKEWTEIYMKENYAIFDVVLAFAMLRYGSYRWSDIWLPDVRGVSRKAKKYGLKYGAVFVFRTSANKRSFISVARHDRELTDDEMATVTDLASSFFNRIDEDSPFSQGDIDVLQRLAEGRNVKDIAADLNISAAAVKQRMKRARQRLWLCGRI